MDLEKRLQVAYDKVAEWPENRMKLEAVIELGPGFTDLLELRNLIPEVIKALPKFNVVKGDIIMTVPKSLFDELNKWVGELSHFPSEPATELRLYGRVIIRPE